MSRKSKNAPAPARFTPPPGSVQWTGKPGLDQIANRKALAVLEVVLPFHRWDYSVVRGLYVVKHPCKHTEYLLPGDWIVPAGETDAGPIVQVFAADGTLRLTREELLEARRERALEIGRALGRTSDEDILRIEDLELRREHGEEIEISPEMFGAVPSEAASEEAQADG